MKPKFYKIIKEGTFKPPFDKAGLKVRLSEKRAADYVAKGLVEELPEGKPEAKKADKTPKKGPKKAAKKATK